MKKQFAVVAALAAACVSLLAFAPVAPAAAPSATPTVGAVTGSFGTGGTFAGTLANIRFVNQNGVLKLVGDLSGTLTNAAGDVIGTITSTNPVPITLPVGAANPTGCSILDLTLGPLDLHLLGLNVHLNEVHLTITGTTGPGQLLGNLLCGLANLLNGPGGGGGLATLLNNLLGL
jgi:hypothetical protein